MNINRLTNARSWRHLGRNLVGAAKIILRKK
jgi:hypothetical protein